MPAVTKAMVDPLCRRDCTSRLESQLTVPATFSSLTWAMIEFEW
jgi:hypothetical protein